MYVDCVKGESDMGGIVDHLHTDIGYQKAGATVVVNLGSQANVRVMDQGQYRNYKAGRRHQFYGGGYKKSPARITLPRSGHFVVAVDLGGRAGRVSASVNVVPPPQGLLPEARATRLSAASQVAVRSQKS